LTFGNSKSDYSSFTETTFSRASFNLPPPTSIGNYCPSSSQTSSGLQTRRLNKGAKFTREERAEVDHGVGEGRGVEYLPGVDLVGPELVGRLHPRGRNGGRRRNGARRRLQAGEEARSERGWRAEDGGETRKHLQEATVEMGEEKRVRHLERKAGAEDVGLHCYWAACQTVKRPGLVPFLCCLLYFFLTNCLLYCILVAAWMSILLLIRCR
jgi:hypothetical protein